MLRCILLWDITILLFFLHFSVPGHAFTSIALVGNYFLADTMFQTMLEEKNMLSFLRNLKVSQGDIGGTWSSMLHHQPLGVNHTMSQRKHSNGMQVDLTWFWS